MTRKPFIIYHNNLFNRSIDIISNKNSNEYCISWKEIFNFYNVITISTLSLSINFHPNNHDIHGSDKITNNNGYNNDNINNCNRRLSENNE